MPNDVISPHFTRDEFACHCGCGRAGVDVFLIEILEDVRTWFKKPITILSGFRCTKHNQNVGGAVKSKHVEGTAADIFVKDVPPRVVHAYLEKRYPHRLGLGLYISKNFVHIDSDFNRRRWRQE